MSCDLPIEAKGQISSDGVVDLKWHIGDSSTSDSLPTFRLEEKVGEGEWEPRYEGTDHSSVRTGLAEGIHQFRVLDLSSNHYSEPLTITVRYMDATRVRFLLITGGIVVLATIIAIIHGHLTHRREEAT